MPEKQLRMWNFDQPLSDGEVLMAFAGEQLMTRREVAVKLRRSKSPTLVSRLNRLAQEGLLLREFYTLPNGVDMHVYSLTAAGLQAVYEISGENPVFAPLEEGA